jgi:hypothetical protein
MPYSTSSISPLAVPEIRNLRFGKVGPRQDENHRVASGNVRASQ